MKRTLERILYLALILLLSVVGCDEAEITQTLDDITSDDYVGMVLIPAGDVQIGAPADEILEIFFEKGVALRQQTVFVDDFYIDTYEVTYAEFFDFVQSTGSDAYYQGSLNQDPNHPVQTNFEGAQAYAKWAGKRLPTEAEWEKAAQGGLEGTRYPWGNAFPTDDHARIQGEQYRTDIINGPVAVGQYPPNGYGLYDMAGNVSEWVDASAINGRQPVYGGSWLSGSSWYCRIYIRELRPPQASTGHGFRCVTDTN